MSIEKLASFRKIHGPPEAPQPSSPIKMSMKGPPTNKKRTSKDLLSRVDRALGNQPAAKSFSRQQQVKDLFGTTRWETSSADLRGGYTGRGLGRITRIHSKNSLQSQSVTGFDTQSQSQYSEGAPPSHSSLNIKRVDVSGFTERTYYRRSTAEYGGPVYREEDEEEEGGLLTTENVHRHATSQAGQLRSQTQGMDDARVIRSAPDWTAPWPLRFG